MAETKYQKIYRKVFKKVPHYGNSERGFILLDYFDPCAILDVGCGQGLFVKEAHKRGFVTRGMDVASGVGIQHDASTEFPFDDKVFDIAVTFDMLEHLTEEDAAFALSEMERVADKVVVKTGHESHKVAGVELHLIQQPVEWWLDFVEKSTKLRYEITLGDEYMVFSSGK